MFGHGFVRALHAFGVPWVIAAGVWSAAGSAVAAGLLVLLARRLTVDGLAGGMRIVVALAPVVVVVLHPVWLISATQAEVYSWWYAWVAGAALYALTWLDQIGAPPECAGEWGCRAEVSARRWATGWGLICGLGLAHHLMSVVFVLPLTLALIVALVRTHQARSSMIVWALVGSILPLGTYGFVAWRAFHPAEFQWPIEPTWLGVWAHIRGAAYGGYLGGFAPLPWHARLIREAVLPFLPMLVVVAIWALRAPERLRAGLLALAASGVALVTFVFAYRVPDPALYFMPALLVGGLATIPMLSWLARRTRPAVAIGLLVAAAIATASWSVNHALAERVRLARADSVIRAAWTAIPFEQGIVLWNDDHSSRLRLLQLLEGSRPGLYVVNPNLLTWGPSRRQFAERLGFDPVAGVELRTRADVDRVVENVRRQATVPVVEFPEAIERTRVARLEQ
jgi:hypothetical protein